MSARVILTYDDYAALPDDGRRYELHEGELLVNPAPSPRHQVVIGNLHVLRAEHVRRHGLGEVFLSPIDVILSRITVLQPDLVYVDTSRLAIITERAIEGALALHRRAGPRRQAGSLRPVRRPVLLDRGLRRAHRGGASPRRRVVRVDRRARRKRTHRLTPPDRPVARSRRRLAVALPSLVLLPSRTPRRKPLKGYATGPRGPVASSLRGDYFFPFGCHIAIVAPVGSAITLIVPCSPTSITSTTTLAPRSFAFLVDARTSSTPTYAIQ